MKYLLLPIAFPFMLVGILVGYIASWLIWGWYLARWGPRRAMKLKSMGDEYLKKAGL